MRSLFAVLAGVGAGLLPGVAAAQGLPAAGGGDPLYGPSFQILFKLFVIAAVLEQALALLFNWRPFRDYLDERAAKPLLAFVTAAFLVWWFRINLLSDLLALYGGDRQATRPDGVVSGALTALILGGGSSAVNNLLTTFGLRPVREATIVPRPPATVAWVAVQVVRSAAVGTVTVLALDTAGLRHALGTVEPAVAGRVRGFFLRDAGRFPPLAGHGLAPGVWSIVAEGRDKGGAVVASAIWGPYQVDAGSVIDLRVVV